MQQEVKALNGLIETISQKMIDKTINDRYLISRMAVIVNEFDETTNSASVIIPTDLQHPTTYKYPNRTGRNKLNSTVWENGNIKVYGDKVYLIYQTNNISQGWLEINEPLNIVAPAPSKGDIDLYEDENAVYHALDNTTVEHLQNGWVFDDSIVGDYTDTNISFVTSNVVPLTQCSTNLWYDTNTIIGFNNFTLTYNGSPYVYDFVTSLDVGGGVGTGTLNILTGELTMTHVYYEITGSTCVACSFEGTNLCRVNAPSLKYGTNNQYKSGVCDRYTVATSYGAVNGHNGTIAFNSGSGGSFLLCDDNITTYQQLVASLNANPIHIVYPLSMTYQFTARPLSSIVGTNTAVATNPVTIRYTDGGLFRADGDAVVLRNSSIVNDVGYLTSSDFKTLNNTSIVGTGNITIDKSFVGLGNVDNTSDVNKPISTAMQTALDGKQATLVSGTNIKTLNNNSILGSGNLDIAPKFVKGTPIDLYDTDGTTVLYSRNPENLVFYDGQEGSQVASNFIWAKPVSSISMSTANTTYKPTLTIKKSKGTGFEIDSNGNIKCNKNGTIRVHVVGYFSASTASLNTVRVFVTKNGTAENDWVASAYGTANEISSQAIVNVVAGDLINMGAYCLTANWASLSNNSTILCEYIQDYYITQNIDISKNTIYSTTESVAGQWIDGKPIYRKVVSLGALPNATTKNVAHGISNIDLVISLRGFATNGTYYTAIPAIGVSSLNYAINIQMTSTNVSVSAGNNRSDYTGYAIIEYTKTTD